MPRLVIPRLRLLASVLAALSVAVAASATFAQSVPPSAAAAREAISARSLDLQSTERDLVLKSGAATVARQRVEQLQSELESSRSRLATDEAGVANLEQRAIMLKSELASLEASLPQHEAADRLVELADAAQARFQTLVDARTRLQAESSAIRKSAVDWRSKAADAEQQLATLIAQQPALAKAATDSKVAADSADAAVVSAQNTVAAAKSAMELIAQQLQTSEAQVLSAKASQDRLTNSVSSLEASFKTLTEASALTGVDATSTLSALQKAITDFAPIRANMDALAEKVATQRDIQLVRLTAATATHDQAVATMNAAATTAEAARTGLATSVGALEASSSQQTAHEKVKTDAARWQTVLNAQLASTEPSLLKLSAEMQLVESSVLVARREAEVALEPLGRFVSFARHVAPVFARRCVACHNTRSAAGRLNVDSFAALAKGGESGPAFDPHHSASSLMITMMADGSMPKDAEPVTPEELDVVRRWIDAGAPLDAGFIASADLFDVMPELVQPLPPVEYRVPIPVTAVAWSPDGSLLASSGYHEILLWNATDGSLARRLTNVAERIYDLEFSRDGARLAVAAGTPGQLGEVKLFNVGDGQLQRTLIRARDAVFAVSFSPDDSLLASGGADRTVSIVRVADGAVLKQVEDHADWVMDVAWSPNGQRIVSSSRDKSCKVFDAATGNPVITFSGHGEPVYSAAFLSDNQSIVSGGSDRRLRVWQTSDAKELRAMAPFGGDIFRLQIMPGDQVLSASGDRILHLHNATDGAEVRQFAGHNDWVYTLATHVATKRIASGSYDGEIRVWNSEDGTMTTSFIAIPGTVSHQSVAAVSESPIIPE